MLNFANHALIWYKKMKGPLITEKPASGCIQTCLLELFTCSKNSDIKISFLNVGDGWSAHTSIRQNFSYYIFYTHYSFGKTSSANGYIGLNTMGAFISWLIKETALFLNL